MNIIPFFRLNQINLSKSEVAQAYINTCAKMRLKKMFRSFTNGKWYNYLILLMIGAGAGELFVPLF